MFCDPEGFQSSMLISELAFRNCLHLSEKCSESLKGVKNYSFGVPCASRLYLAVGSESEEGMLSAVGTSGGDDM